MSSDPGHDAWLSPTGVRRGGHPEETNAASVTEAFDALADATRRHLLYHLAEETDGSATVSDIADRLDSIDHLGEFGDRQTVVVDLHHRHLPRLEEVGLVEHDADAGTVRYRGDPLVEECLALVAVRDAGLER